MTIERFEDIQAWQVARELTGMVYEATKGEAFRRDYGLKDQVRRASVSAMSNIAEGFERGSHREFVRFLFYAKGSAGEVRSQLVVALDLGYITEDRFRALDDKAVHVSSLLGKFIVYLKTLEC